jgi:NADP-dependent aldehyde dehydrogenase
MPHTPATSADVLHAVNAAWDAFAQHPDVEARARTLDCAAARLDAHPGLVRTVCDETGYPEPRVRTELVRTTAQLRAFAALIREGSWCEPTIDRGDPARTPTPKPDLRRMLFPLGPVGVFGASNFPLAYGVAGGDTASALASGCPVIVKGHSAHPRTGERIAGELVEACREGGLPAGFFAYLPAWGERDVAVGVELVQHPRLRAVGFTGSHAGGMAIVRLAQERPEPIPVYAEMGSVNPVFVLPGAAASRGREIGALLAGSAMLSVGQMCTCPGLIFLPPGSDAVADAMREAFDQATPTRMVSERVAAAFASRVRELAGTPGVRVLAGGMPPTAGPRAGTPTLLETTSEVFRRGGTLREECFGPETLLVRCADAAEFFEIARTLPGALTGSIFAEFAGRADAPAARDLAVLLRDRVGRLIFNGVPTGVEVVPAMTHSGPYPACSRPESTAVGTYAIRRWCRPVTFQNAPPDFLPEELRDANPRRLWRMVDGVRMQA